MFVVFYTVNTYFCILTCSTSCCLYDMLMDPWNVYMCSNEEKLDVKSQL